MKIRPPSTNAGVPPTSSPDQTSTHSSATATTATTTTTTTTRTTIAPPGSVDHVDAFGAPPTTSAALRSAQLGLVATNTSLASTPRAVSQASLGARLLDSVQSGLSKMSMGLKAAIIGFALTAAAPSTAFADTVFLDHNDAPMEIAVARQLAASKGEPFVLIRPDTESLDALFAKAERGEANIRHLILSGHSSGTSVWGQGADGEHHSTSIHTMRSLKEKYPAAFAQVQHVTFMSCYAGSAGNSAEWSAVFPNARAISGFHGSGPSKTQPAAHQMLKHTELAVRQLEGKGRLSPQQALVMAKQIAHKPGTRVTLFGIRLDGVHYGNGVKATPLDRALDQVELLQTRAYVPYFEATASGFTQPPHNHGRSELRDYYNALHALSSALPDDSDERAQISERVDVTIRLIYFDVITARFAAEHAGLIDDAAKEAIADPSLGVQLPQNLGQLTRGEVRTLVEQLSALDLDDAPALTRLRTLLQEGLVELSPAVIPATWIG